MFGSYRLVFMDLTSFCCEVMTQQDQKSAMGSW